MRQKSNVGIVLKENKQNLIILHEIISKTDDFESIESNDFDSYTLKNLCHNWSDNVLLFYN